MAAVNRPKTQNGYGEKLKVKIVTVQKEKRRVECATRDGAMIWAAVWETPTVFRWPEVGEEWTVRRDMNVWRLDQIVHSEVSEAESEAVPKSLETLPEGDTRIIGETVHVTSLETGPLKSTAINATSINATSITAAEGLYTDYGIVEELPKVAAKGQMCTFKAATGIYWRLLYTGEATYPWAKIGGPPLRTYYNGAVTTASPTPQTTNAPSLTAPLTMEFDFSIGTILQNSQVAELNEVALNAYVGTTNVFYLASVASTTFGGSGGELTFRATATKGELAQARYRSGQSKSVVIQYPIIAINPVRVG